MLAGASLPSLVLAAIFASAFPPVAVSVEPGLACPTPEAIERAVAAAREGDPAASGPGYRLRVGRTGDTVRVDLTGPDGAPVWTRRLPGGPAACTSGAEAIALIVEREFRQIAWTPPATGAPQETSADRAADSRGPAASVVSARASGGDTPAAGRWPQTPALLPSLAPRLVASVGPALWSRSGAAALAVEGRVRLSGAWQAGLGAILPPSRSSLILYTAADGSTPQASVVAVPFLVAVGVERPVARRVALGAAGEGLLTFERGESIGIALPRTAWRTVLAGGISAGGALGLGDRVRLDVRVGGYRTLLGRSFTVDGVGGDLLEPPAWQALVRVGLGWVFVP